MNNSMRKIVKDWLERSEENEKTYPLPPKVTKNKNLNRYTHKSNNGSDFGSINIYYSEIEPISLNYQKVNYIDPTKDSVISSGYMGKVKNFRIMPDLPPYMEFDTDTGNIIFTSDKFKMYGGDQLGDTTIYTVKAEGNDLHIKQQFTIFMLNVFTTEERIYLPNPGKMMFGPGTVFTSKPKLPDGVKIDSAGSIIYGAFDSTGIPDIIEWFNPTTYSISAWVRRDKKDDQSKGAITPDANWKVGILVKPVIPMSMSYPMLSGEDSNYNFEIGKKIDYRRGKVLLDHDRMNMMNSFPTGNESFKEKKGLRFTVSPDLPEGMKIGEFTGIIWGKPKKETELTEYIITATNSYTSIATSVKFSVGKIVRFIGTTYHYTSNSTWTNLQLLSYAESLIVDWGDGQIETFTAPQGWVYPYHDYQPDGNSRTVTITGDINYFIDNSPALTSFRFSSMSQALVYVGIQNSNTLTDMDFSDVIDSNVNQLFLNNSAITQIGLGELPSRLETLSLAGSRIERLDVSDLSSLGTLQLDSCVNITSSVAPKFPMSLNTLSISYCNIYSIDLSALSNLSFLSINSNPLNNLTASMLPPNISSLYMSGTSIDMNNFNVSQLSSSLTNLDISDSNFTLSKIYELSGIGIVNLWMNGIRLDNQSLDLSLLPYNIYAIAFNGCGLASVVNDPPASLRSFNASSNAISSINQSQIRYVSELIITFNQISSLDVSGCQNLVLIFMAWNKITNIPTGIGQCPNLHYLDISNNIGITDMNNVIMNLDMAWTNPRYGWFQYYNNGAINSTDGLAAKSRLITKGLSIYGS